MARNIPSIQRDSDYSLDGCLEFVKGSAGGADSASALQV
jgi:hypothetical protein